MKTIEELNREMVHAAQINKRARTEEVTNLVLRAPDSGVSKRQLLGLNSKRRKGSTPLFEDPIMKGML